MALSAAAVVHFQASEITIGWAGFNQVTFGQIARYYRDPGVATWRKALGVVAAAYVVMPVDLVPDLIWVLGWLDDFGVVAAATWLIRKDVLRHASQASARGAGSRP